MHEIEHNQANLDKMLAGYLGRFRKVCANIVAGCCRGSWSCSIICGSSRAWPWGC